MIHFSYSKKANIIWVLASEMQSLPKLVVCWLIKGRKTNNFVGDRHTCFGCLYDALAINSQMWGSGVSLTHTKTHMRNYGFEQLGHQYLNLVPLIPLFQFLWGKWDMKNKIYQTSELDCLLTLVHMNQWSFGISKYVRI